MDKKAGVLQSLLSLNQHRRIKWAAFLLLVAVVPVFLLFGVARSQQVVDAAYIERVCGRCHGKAGITDNSNMPILAGQNTGYLVTQMKNFRSGFRRSSVMSPLARGMDDDAIAFIADYYNRAGGRGALPGSDSVPQ